VNTASPVQEQVRQMRQVMDAMPEGVLLLDAGRRLALTNSAAQEFLDLLAGAQGGDVLTHLGHRPLSELLAVPTKGMWHEVPVNGRSFGITARPLEDGVPAGGWVLVIRDITLEQDIQQRLRQQERLAAVGQLAAGISHDFNNIMATIALYAQLSLRVDDLPPKVHKYLAAVSQQARRASDLIQQITDFGRRTAIEQRPLNLQSFLQELVELLERTLPENIEINLNYGAGEYIVSADPTRIQQVIINLALNARDAMPEGGALRIRLDRVRIKPGASALVPVESEEWVRVTVADTGVGIPTNVLPRIFEPFFTTKPPNRGAGLGLAQVHGIVKQHRGEIEVKSRVNRGTIFTIYLPALQPEGGVAPPLEAEAIVKGKGEIVLVVEDDAPTRRAVVESLEELNYRALAAENGREALAVVEQHGGIALVLSDAVMPEMGGIALLRALKQRDPAVKVVMLTGHWLEKEMENLRGEGLVDWLPKPPTLERLAEVVGRALGHCTLSN